MSCTKTGVSWIAGYARKMIAEARPHGRPFNDKEIA
jgi:hypothetical protein